MHWFLKYDSGRMEEVLLVAYPPHRQQVTAVYDYDSCATQSALDRTTSLTSHANASDQNVCEVEESCWLTLLHIPLVLEDRQ